MTSRDAMLRERRCPNCRAPIDVSESRIARCRYCNASLVVESPAPPTAVTRRETLVVRLDVVGPSNRASIAKLIEQYVGLSPSEAEAMASHAPCEVVTWDPSGRAEEFRRALFERGAAATVIQRFVEVPVLPPVDVMLDEAGENKVAVMKVVREYVNVGLVEAKHLVESAPCVLIQGLEGTRAHAFRDALVALGAKARTIA